MIHKKDLASSRRVSPDFSAFPVRKKKKKKSEEKTQTSPGSPVIKIQWDFGIAALHHRQVISRFAGFEPFAVLLTKL